ncbi:MAG: DUF3037 domain-containing protein [Oscillochloridaceae bacterium]|nr:DUF3037 domain-containing protein [Chloroflexaceae bacterium]MDW8391615.1 DUF3037 domain-containing protein [Oscillochloridaceae bacterium]
MPATSVFEYALMRVVPRIERGEYVNVGVVLLCRQHGFLEARLRLDPARLRTLDPTLDLELLEVQLAHIPIICAGGLAAGPIGALPHYERFRWLTAPRSTVIQPSPVHTGLCTDPRVALERIFVRSVGEGGA